MNRKGKEKKFPNNMDFRVRRVINKVNKCSVSFLIVLERRDKEFKENNLARKMLFYLMSMSDYFISRVDFSGTYSQ